ncbi:MAG: hypothetical protein R3234_03440 [Thermoanaerobaculia bacterium]|nr:hypothetical protein [Thermoanaerobaculia bacterium]
MSDSVPEVRIETCERHGLKFNAAAQPGCVRCRREAGNLPEGRKQPPARGDAGSSPTLGAQMALTATLVFGTGFLFFTAHQRMVRDFTGLVALGGSETGSTTHATGVSGSRAEQEIAWRVEMIEGDPYLDEKMDADPELRRLVESLHDPDFREELARDPELRRRHFDAIDRRLYPELAPDDSTFR